MFNKKLKQEIYELTSENEYLRKLKDNYSLMVRAQEEDLNTFYSQFPLQIGQEVYEVQLRSKTGRFTKTKPSKEHSTISCITVDKKNYFNLVDKLNNGSLFTCEVSAEEYLNSICID